MNHRRRREFKMLQGQIPATDGTNRTNGGTVMSNQRPVARDIFETRPSINQHNAPHDNVATRTRDIDNIIKSDILLSVSKVLKEEFDKIEDTVSSVIDNKLEGMITDILNAKMEEIVGTVLHYVKKETEETRLHINLVETTVKDAHRKEIETLRREIERLNQHTANRTASPLEKQKSEVPFKLQDLQNRERLNDFLTEQAGLRPNKRLYVNIPEGPLTGFKSYMSAKGKLNDDSDVFFLHIGTNHNGFTIIGNLRYILMVFLIICKSEDYNSVITTTDIIKSYKVSDIDFYHRFSLTDLTKVNAFYAGFADKVSTDNIREFFSNVVGSDYF